MKPSFLLVFSGLLALSLMAVPASADNSRSHSLTVTTSAPHGYSCSNPIVISGIATGRNPLRRDVRITVSYAYPVEGNQVVLHTKAEVRGGQYSVTVTFTNPNMAEGDFSVTASWQGQTASDDYAFYWAC